MIFQTVKLLSAHGVINRVQSRILETSLLYAESQS